MNEATTIDTTNEIAITKTVICGSHFDRGIVVYSAWEPCDGHREQMTIDGETCGRIGTRRLPADLEAPLPMSDERIKAVDAWHAAQYGEAYTAIVNRYPEAGMNGHEYLGEIRKG